MPDSTPTQAPRDFQQHLAELDKAGLLVRIDRPINKDTELQPLVRWQFVGGVPEAERRAFLFTNVVDGKGKRFDMPVAIGVYASSPEIYALGIRDDQGVALHPQTGVLWASEHGPRGGDEINIAQAGRNYGWPKWSFGRTYEGPRISPTPPISTLACASCEEADALCTISTASPSSIEM